MRITAIQALEHLYVAQFHDPAVERTAARCVHTDGRVGGMADKLDDNEKLPTHKYRTSLYEEMTKQKAATREAAYSNRSAANSNR